MSKLGKNHGPFFCLACLEEFRPNHSTAAKFCSNKCQKNHEFTLRLNRWLYGVEEKSPRFLRRALAEKDGHKCMACDLTEWMGRPITLELDHIDGNHENNRIDNLRLICPNCHSQTNTYKNRNYGKGRPHRRKIAKVGSSTLSTGTKL
jgi:5-methylcytosine-specific restriction endonuclease McrA